NGIIASPEPEPVAPERIMVNDALDKYSEYIRHHRSLRTFRTYRPILASFKNFCGKTHIDEIERADLLDFATHCLNQSQTGKSVYNKLVVLSLVLKHHGPLETSECLGLASLCRDHPTDFRECGDRAAVFALYTGGRDPV